MADKTYSEEEHNALLAQVADLKAQVADLAKANEASELDAKVAEVKAEMDTQVADLQSKLDAAVLEAEAAKAERTAVITWLDDEKAKAEAAAEFAARKDDRIAKVKEVASFPDEYLAANADRFAAMSDEIFETALEDWAVIAPKKSEKKEEIPAKTAMTAARTNTDTPSVLAEVLNLRFDGIDVRSVH